MVLIDAGLVLYVGLAVLFVWRYFCAWRCCGKWLQYANYCSLLLALIFVILGYDSYLFVKVAMSSDGQSCWTHMPLWLKWWVLAAPGTCLVIYLLSATQTYQHVERIKEETAVLRHDRAVQIVLLPAVYSVMAMSSLTRMYNFVSEHAGSADKSSGLHDALSRSETCFWVGDLYEAWALFQFGKLTLEVIESGIMAQSKSPIAQAAAAANGLRISHKVVESLVWLGILSFLLVCVAEAGWSLWLLTFEKHMTSHDFDQSMSQFTIAGFFASGAAIYNIYIVEESYHIYLANYYPRYKFLTVKVLVSFAFLQRAFLRMLQSTRPMMPTDMRQWFDNVPGIGTLINFPADQFEMFYGALIVTECLFVCVAHYWAWDAREEWYDAADVELEDDQDLETTALMAQSYQSKKAQLAN